MYRTGALALFAAAALCGSVTPAQAATFLTVGPNNGCDASGCFSDSRRTFTQTFSAAERAGTPISITSLALFRGVVGAMENHAVKVTFQLADGSEVSWGKFTIAVLAGEVVSLGGPAVTWDSSLGDLTVKLELIIPGKGGAGGFGGAGPGGGAGGLSSLGGGPSMSLPLVRPTAPPVQPLISTPEPGTWALMLLGFGGVGAMLRRRRAWRPSYG